MANSDTSLQSREAIEPLSGNPAIQKSHWKSLVHHAGAWTETEDRKEMYRPEGGTPDSGAIDQFSEEARKSHQEAASSNRQLSEENRWPLSNTYLRRLASLNPEYPVTEYAHWRSLEKTLNAKTQDCKDQGIQYPYEAINHRHKEMGLTAPDSDVDQEVYDQVTNIVISEYIQQRAALVEKIREQEESCRLRADMIAKRLWDDDEIKFKLPPIDEETVMALLTLGSVPSLQAVSDLNQIQKESVLVDKEIQRLQTPMDAEQGPSVCIPPETMAKLERRKDRWRALHCLGRGRLTEDSGAQVDSMRDDENPSQDEDSRLEHEVANDSVVSEEDDAGLSEKAKGKRPVK